MFSRARQDGVETGPKFDQGPYPTPHGDAALIGFDQAVEHFQQGALTGTVGADQPQAFATFEFKGNIVDSPEIILAQLFMAALAAKHFRGNV